MGTTIRRAANASATSVAGRRDGTVRAAEVCAWIAVTAIVLWLSAHGWGTFQLGVYQDDAVYVVLARSIVSGAQYGLINQPGVPAPPLFPFGFPLVLAPVLWWFPNNVESVVVVSLVTTLVNIGLIFWGWHVLAPNTSRWWGLAAASLYGCNPMIVAHARMALSEPVFMTCVLLVLLTTEAVACGRGSSVLLGALLAYAVSIRSAGVALCLASVLRLSMGARPTIPSLVRVACGAVAMLLLVLALTNVRIADLSPRRYMVELRTDAPETPSRDPNGVRPGRTGLALRDFRRMLIPVGGGEQEQQLAERLGMRWWPRTFGLLLAGLVALGAWRTYQTRALSPAVHVFELVYVVLFLLWPFHLMRLLYPIQPLLALQLVVGVGAVSAVLATMLQRHALAARVRTAAIVVTCAVVVAMSCWKSTRIRETATATRDLRVGTTWLKEHTPPGAIVMAHYPQSIYLYAQRSVVDLTAQDGAELDRDLEQRGVDYVLLGPVMKWRDDGTLFYDATQQALLAALEERAARGRVTRVYESAPDLVRVYRVERVT